jgi:four helix bundle protein
LIVWQKAMDLAVRIGKFTKQLPKDEMFGLALQLRRCSLSVPSNIAEGHGRLTRRDYRNFLGTARGSLSETRTQIHYAVRMGYLEKQLADELLKEATLVAKLLNSLINSLGEKNP